MRKTKIFQTNLQKVPTVEAEIDAWLAHNAEKKIIGTAANNTYLFIIYED